MPYGLRGDNKPFHPARPVAADQVLSGEHALLDTPNFAGLGLSDKVECAVAAAGYKSPTPIQVQAIPVAVKGMDVLGIAQTGTGKTASFTLPMITRLETGRARARMPRSLILAPTRELAAQVAQAFENYGVNHKLNVALLIGGVSFDEQEKKLDRGADVLIATPGRMLDHVQRGKLLLNGVEILVIDEADRMLDMGFIPDIERICKLLPVRRQTLFFSATMPPEIQRLVDQFLRDPVRIEVTKPATAAMTITQTFKLCIHAEDWAKREILRDWIRAQNIKNAIIFCNRKRDVAILHKSLLKHGFNAGALHGDMDQGSRMDTLDKFRQGNIDILAASDVAARGLDIPDVSHVFNFDVPWAADDYVHRIGRTGRAGRSGFAATLVTFEELHLIKEIEKITGQEITWDGEAPTDDDIENAGKKKRSRSRGRGRRDGEDKTPPPPRNRRKGGRVRGRDRPDEAGEDGALPAGGAAAAGGETTALPAHNGSRRRNVNSGPRQRRDASSELPDADGFTPDSMPAFLKRPIRRPKEKRAQKEDTESASEEISSE